VDGVICLDLFAMQPMEIHRCKIREVDVPHPWSKCWSRAEEGYRTNEEKWQVWRSLASGFPRLIRCDVGCVAWLTLNAKSFRRLCH
jgi:hypothetical protein